MRDHDTPICTETGSAVSSALARVRARLRTLVICLLLAALSIILYWDTLENAFVLDDIPVVRENTLLRSRQGAITLLHSGYWERMKSEERDLLYRPVTMLSFALDYAVAGGNPRWYHAVNVLLNALVVLLVFHCVRSLTDSTFIAFITAALFAALPCHVEAITLVVGRAELLSALFGLCAWFLHLRGGKPCFLFSLPLMGLAALSKENAVVFPMLILAGDIGRRRPASPKSGSLTGKSPHPPPFSKGGNRRFFFLFKWVGLVFPPFRKWGKWRFLPASETRAQEVQTPDRPSADHAWRGAVSPNAAHTSAGKDGGSPGLAVAIRRFLGYGAVLNLCMAMRYVVLGAFTSSPNVSYFGANSWIVTWLTMGKYFFQIYFRWLVLGTGMNPACTHYGYPNATTQDVAAWALLGVLTVAALAVVVRFIRRPSLPVYGAFFFLVAIAPVSNFFVRIGALAAVRFLYLPSMGYCLLAACVAWRVFSWAGPRRGTVGRLLGVAGCVLLGAYFRLIAVGIACFRNEETVYRCILEHSPEARFATHGLALALSNRGRTEQARALLESAYRQDSGFDAGIGYSLGMLYAREGRLVDAERLFRDALERNHDAGMLSDLHAALGNVLEAKGDSRGAKLEFLHAAARNYENATAHNNLANSWFKEGQLPLAERHYRTALELNAALEQAWQGLGTALVAQGRYRDAIDEVYSLAMGELTRQSWAFAGMGRAFMGLGERERAEEALMRSLELDGKNVDALTNLAALHLEMGMFRESIETGERALQASAQERPEVVYNLAVAYEGTDKQRALALWKRFLLLAENDPRYSAACETAKRRMAKLGE